MIDNDTDLTIEELLNMFWTTHSIEVSNYSTHSATTYREPSGKYVKKVWNDGYTEFYELG